MVIHESVLGDEVKLTLVNANSEQEAKQLYLDKIGLQGQGTQLEVEKIDTSKPSIIFSVIQKQQN